MTAPPLIDVHAAVAGVLAGAAAAALTRAWWRPLPRAAARIRPYNTANRVRLGRPPDLDAPGQHPTGTLAAVLAPLAAAGGRAVSRLVDRDGDAPLRRRLRHAGYAPQLGEDERLVRYRRQRLSLIAGWGLAGALPGLAAGSGGLLAAGITIGAAVGAHWCTGRLEHAIRSRRQRMTIDLYTVNQHLAQLLATGRSIDEALQRFTARAAGPVADELAEALRWRRAGMPLPETLETLARHSPEPHAARTYRTLAKSAAGGIAADAALRALAEDVRASRRDALHRLAVRRRHAMIAVIFVFLVPVTLLFVAAPLPAQLLGQPP